MSRKVRFTGFEAGTGVSLSAAQGGVSRGPVSISAWAIPAGDPWSGAAENETLSISVEEVYPEGDHFAPLNIEFRIRVSGSPVGERPAEADWETSLDPTFTGIQTILHTGDSGLYKNEWVGAPAHRDKAYEYGNNPGHVYSSPGSYDVRVYAYDKHGNWGVWQRSSPLEVLNPDDTFDAASTIVLDPDGNFSGAPHEGSLPAANMVTSMTDAFARFNAIKQSVSKGVRITVRSGALIEDFATTECNMLFTKGRCCFDLFGGTDQMTYTEQTAAPPSLADPSLLFFRTQGGGDFGWNIAMRGWKLLFNAYNPQTGGPWHGWQNGTLRSGFFGLVVERGQDPAHNFRNVFDDVEVQGLAAEVFGCQPRPDQYTFRSAGLFLKDCVLKNNTEYRVRHTSNLFLLGCRFDEDFGMELGYIGADRVAGGPRGFKGHPTIRDASSYMTYIRATFMETRGAWSGQLSGLTSVSEQPLHRVVKGGVSHRKFYICDSVMVGDIIVGKHHDDNSGYQTVYECCMLFHNPQNHGRDNAYITGLGGGKVFRNCQHIVLNTPELGDSASDPALTGKNLEKFEVNGSNLQTGLFKNFYEVDEQPFCLGLRMELIHNDYIMLRPTSELREPTHELYDETVIFKDNNANPTGETDTVSNLYDVHVGNNVHYAPNIDIPIGPDPADIETLDLPTGFRIPDVWMKTVWEIQTFTLASDLAPGETTPVIPYPNDWYNQQTTQADYNGSLGNHSVRVAGWAGDPPQTRDAPMAGVSTISPRNGDLRVPDRMNITMTFDAAMNTSAGTIVLNAKDGSPVTFDLSAGDGVWSSGDTVLTLTPPSDLSQNDMYWVTYTGLQQSDGTPIADLATIGGKTKDETWYFEVEKYKDFIQQPYGFNIKFIAGEELDALTINFQSDGFAVTNRSDHTWLAGETTVILDRGATAMAPDTLAAVDSTEVKLYRAATAQPLDPGIDSALFDFNRDLRPNAGFAISPSSGTNAAGAILPA